MFTIRKNVAWFGGFATFGIISILIISLATSCKSVEHYKLEAQKYKEAACLLSDVCKFSLESECLDLPGFENRYYDMLDNLDCQKDLHVDKDFIMSLSYYYTPEKDYDELEKKAYWEEIMQDCGQLNDSLTWKK